MTFIAKLANIVTVHLNGCAGLAQLIERFLAKEEVESLSLLTRTIFYFWPIWPFFNVFETKNNPLKIRGLATVFVACVATLFAMLVVVVAIKLSNHNFVLFNHNVTIMTQKKSRVKPGTACVSFL